MKKNKKKIKLFTGGQGSKKDLKKFLFDMQGLFAAYPGVDFTDEYKARCISNFAALFDLVDG